MSKKLNIIEAMKMPIGTEFEVEYEEGSIDISKITLYSFNGVKLFKWSSGNIVEADEIILLESRFIPIQQPVSFMEVVNCDKKCKVEHDFIKNNYYKENYFCFDKLISDLSTHSSSEDLRKIIKEGKWYIEGSEDIEECN